MMSIVLHFEEPDEVDNEAQLQADWYGKLQGREGDGVGKGTDMNGQNIF